MGINSYGAKDSTLSHNTIEIVKGDGSSATTGTGIRFHSDSAGTHITQRCQAIGNEIMTCDGAGIMGEASGGNVGPTDCEASFNNLVGNGAVVSSGGIMFNGTGTVANSNWKCRGNRGSGNTGGTGVINAPAGLSGVELYDNEGYNTERFIGDTTLNSTNFTYTVGYTPEDLYLNPVSDTAFTITRNSQGITPTIPASGVFVFLGRFKPNATLVFAKTGTAAVLRRMGN